MSSVFVRVWPLVEVNERRPGWDLQWASLRQDLRNEVKQEGLGSDQLLHALGENWGCTRCYVLVSSSEGRMKEPRRRERPFSSLFSVLHQAGSVGMAHQGRLFLPLGVYPV